MIRINCQLAAIFQSKLAVLLCVVEDTYTQAVRLNFMFTASQYVFYDIDRLLSKSSKLAGEVRDEEA